MTGTTIIVVTVANYGFWRALNDIYRYAKICRVRNSSVPTWRYIGS
jgi:hypothetical protein